MVLTAYLDESGTHEGSPCTVVAGFYSESQHWAVLEAQWERLRNRMGFAQLHTKELLHGSGAFAGMRWRERLEVAQIAYALARQHAIGFIMVLDNQDYLEILRNSDEGDSKVPVDSRYGVCLRFCLGFLGQSAKIEAAPAIQIVIESGHKNMNAATTAHGEMQGIGGPYGDLVESVTFSNRNDHWQLQLADLLASTAFHAERSRHSGESGGRRQLISPLLLRAPHVHYRRIERADLLLYKKGLSLLSEIRRRYGKGWRSAMRPDSLGSAGIVRLSEDPSAVVQWIADLPVKRWCHLPLSSMPAQCQ